MRDVMDALDELQAANEAIETAGPLYQTREPLKDKIVRLIGQRSDLITQVLALRRELDAARAEVEKLRALPSAEDLEERAHEILDGAGIPTHALDPVSGEEDYRAGLEERLEWTVEEITRSRIENAWLRRVLEEMEVRDA